MVSVGGSTVDPLVSTLPGLTSAAKKPTAPTRREPGDTPGKSPKGRSEARASGSHPVKEELARSRSPKEKKDKPKKRRERKPSDEEPRDRRRRSSKPALEEPEKREAEKPKEREGGCCPPARGVRRESKKGGPHGVPRANETTSGSPGPEIAFSKVRKDRGYNHYIRGKEFRKKYGFDRGRGR